MEIKDIVLAIPTIGDRNDGVTKCIGSAPDIHNTVLDSKEGWLIKVNRVIQGLADYNCAFLMGADDMVFHEGAIQTAVNAMHQHFPDEDGVIGFNQVTIRRFCKTGFTLIGRKFMERFFNQDFFCPDYKHYYADTELLKYAESVNKFFYCEEAKVDHYHFSVTKKKDNTTLVSQSIGSGDKETAKKREEAGLLWGRDFELIN